MKNIFLIVNITYYILSMDIYDIIIYEDEIFLLEQQYTAYKSLNFKLEQKIIDLNNKIYNFIIEIIKLYNYAIIKEKEYDKLNKNYISIVNTYNTSTLYNNNIIDNLYKRINTLIDDNKKYNLIILEKNSEIKKLRNIIDSLKN